MNTQEAGRKGGLSRSPAKQAASRANLAKANAERKCRAMLRRCEAAFDKGKDAEARLIFGEWVQENANS